MKQLKVTVKQQKEKFLKTKTVKGLIKLYEKIPTDRWITEKFNNETNTNFCALGHLGFRPAVPQSKLHQHLEKLFPKEEHIFDNIYEVNDAGEPETAKNRVIKFLKKFI